MRKAKLFITYFPVILVSLQVLVNLLALFNRPLYDRLGFELNTFFGTNVLFAFFLLVFTYAFRFCDVSRGAAWAEFAFAVNYFVVRQDNLYNILFQVIVGAIAISFFLKRYINKFPLCRFSLLHKFLISIFITGNCSKAMDRIEDTVKKEYLKQHERL